MAYNGKTLTVFLAADLRKFNSGLTDAKGSLKSFDTSISGLSNRMSGLLTGALVGATAAAGALATKFAIDGVQAAIADEQAVAKLSQTLSNMGFPDAIDGVESFIDSTQRATGVADDQLRPALDRLIRSTGDVGIAQNSLSLALDIAAGTGKDLEAVANALGKAYDGNTGALGKLGAGLDAAVLKSGNMDTITAQLQERFGGQAATAADTYKGRIDRLGIAFDELKESFGYGFLGGLDDAQGATDDLTRSMKDLEPAMRDIGNLIGDIATSAARATKATYDYDREVRKTGSFLTGAFSIGLVQLADRFGYISDEQGAAEEAAYNLYLRENDLWSAMDQVTRSAFAQAGRLQGLADAMRGTAGAAAGLNAALRGQNEEQARWAAFYQGNQSAQRQFAQATANQAQLWTEYTKKQDDARSGASGLSEANEKLKKSFEAQKDVVQASNTALEDAVGKWNDAKQAVTEYAQNMADKLLGGIDLGTAFEAQFNEAGERSGQTLIQAFDDQIAQATWFANVLGEIKRQNADQSLIEQIASLGPGTGGALAQQMITEGLVPTINDKWTEVRTAMQVAGAGLVPEALLTGQTFAANTVLGLATQLRDDQDKLKKIGKAMGDVIGTNLKADIAKAVAEALAAAEAARNAAAARATAAQATQQVAVTQQSVTQTLNQIINNSNNRTGYTTAQLYQMGVLH